MKKQDLTKVALVLVVASQLLGTEAFAAQHSLKMKERILVHKNESALENPYFQIKSTKVRELTDEEALELIGEDDAGLEPKALILPNIPPKPDAPEIPVTPLPGPGTTPVVAPAKPTTPTVTPTPNSGGVLDGVIMVIDKLIAIGQKIIPTIEKGKAVVTNNPMASVSVLPRFETLDPVVHEMGGWTVPVTKHYKISYSNGFGSEVAAFVYSITYQYNGNVDGKGKYLTGIRASARSIVVSWGFDLDASSQLIQISNVGTQADVIAGATIEIAYTVKNWTRQITTVEGFFVSGDGKLYKMD